MLFSTSKWIYRSIEYIMVENFIINIFLIYVRTVRTPGLFSNFVFSQYGMVPYQFKDNYNSTITIVQLQFR